jgi:hypothetical protein
MPSSKGIYDILQEFKYLFFKFVKALAVNPLFEDLTKEIVETNFTTHQNKELLQ